VQLGKTAHGQHRVQGAEQVDGALHDQDDANGHDQRFHGAEGVQDHDNAQHHAEHRQQQKALPMEKPEEAVDERAADESSLLHRNPDRHMREFLEEIQGHGEPKG